MMLPFRSKILVLAAMITGFLLVVAPQALALSGADFNPGNIISGAVFTNSGAMSPADVQNFLNAKVSCDTNGTNSKSYNYNSTTGRVGNGADPWIATSRAVYGQRYNAWNNTAIAGGPYVCLKDYVENPATHASNLQNPGAAVPGGISAASIISNAAVQYSINPMVLLVTLQKENSLVTDDWPWTNQYRTAMGYGCPDSTPGQCDAAYYGFSNQVNKAAWQFRRYLDSPSGFNYVAGTNTILYSPGNCGSSVVNIVNQATAALYNYTPYQPNAAALRYLTDTSPGDSGDACSTFGNRNFWWYFNRWFGSTQTHDPYSWTVSGSVAYADAAYTVPYSTSPALAIPPGGKAYLTLRARNNGFQTWDHSNVRLGASQPRDRSSGFTDSGWLNASRVAMQETSVQPGEVATFKFALDAPATTGSYRECFNMVAEGVTWMPGSDVCYNIDVVASQESNTDNLSLNAGDSITSGKYLMSPSTHSVAILQSDGNFVLYSDGIAKWNSVTYGNKPSRLIMQTDGNLVLYSESGVPLWFSDTGGHPGARAVLQSDGNLVVYSSGGAPLWFSNTSNVPDFSKSVLHGLQNGPLFPRQSLQWADRSRQLLMQDDGNLVLYANGHPVWATFTQGHPGAYAVMQDDGNFVLYGPDAHVLWATYTNGNPGSRIMLQEDSNMVIYRPDGGWVWQSKTRGQ